MNKFTFLLSLIVLSFLNFITVDSLKCYKCQSDDDPGCAIADVEHIPLWDLETCEDDVEHCAIWIVEQDPVTYRGCKPTSIENATMSECQEDFCNFDKFPEDRLHCYQCQGESYCITIREAVHSFEPCVNYQKDDQCYTIVVDTTTAYRGCLSDVDTPGIEACHNETICDYCIKGETNDQNGVDSSFGCVDCDVSEAEPNPPLSTYCYKNTNPTLCEPLLLGREPDKCFTIKTPESIQRGCLKKDLNALYCDAAGDDCHVCTTFNCNSKAYRGIKCQSCDSRLDDTCEEKPDNPVYCISDQEREEEEVIGCVLREYDISGMKHVARGCVHTITNETLKQSCINHGGNCKICRTDNCNKKLTYQQCIECDSTVDPSCATLEDLTKFRTVTCDVYDDKCYARIGGIDKRGTERGCVSHIPTPRLLVEDPNFRTCDSNNCNILPVPATRIRCFQCNETTDATCPMSDKDLPPFHYCRYYDQNEECYTKVDKDSKRITRGCISDLNGDVCQGDTCKRCNYEGCNRDPKYKKSEMFCVKCEGAAGNRSDSCLWGQDVAGAEQCKATVEFGEQDVCFTTIDDTGVKRGCLLDSSDQCSDPKTCKTCGLFGCNKDNVIKQSCIICDSISDPTCAKNNPDIKMKECPTKLQVFDERWCYTLKEAQNGTIHRGCLSELEEDLKSVCLDEKNKFCDICEDEGCNFKDPPNATGKPKVIWGTVIGLLIILSMFQ